MEHVARTATNAGDYDAAIAALNDATQLVPNEDMVWYNLGQTYAASAKKQTDAAEKTKRYTEASTDLQKAIDLKKQAMQNPPPGGSKTPAQGEPSDNQRLATYYSNLGSVAAGLGKADDATAAYQKAAELNPPGAAGYYFNLGATLTNLNMTGDEHMRKQAVDAFDKAIAADPNNADSYFWKGQALLGMAKMEGENGRASGHRGSFQEVFGTQTRWPECADSKGRVDAACQQTRDHVWQEKALAFDICETEAAAAASFYLHSKSEAICGPLCEFPPETQCALWSVFAPTVTKVYGHDVLSGTLASQFATVD